MRAIKGLQGRAWLLAGMIALAACSPSRAGSTNEPDADSGVVAHEAYDSVPATTFGADPAAPGHHPVSGLAVIPLTVGEHRFMVELAATPDEQEEGLMFRTAMGPDEGMLFPLESPRQSWFWMKNTVIPLDIIFIDSDHRVLNIAPDAIPYDETPIGSRGKAAAILELNAGRAAELGIKDGDPVSW